MKIGIDAMGGDYAPHETVSGGLLALNEFDDVSIVLFGDKDKLLTEVNSHGDGSLDRIEIINTEEIISNDDAPVAAIKNKKNSSMVCGLDYLKHNKIDAFVSAGNTGALMAGGLLKLGRISNVDRPALVSPIPTKTGLAVMGSAYVEEVLDIKRPRIGLLNVGAEEGKGNDLTKRTYKLLSDAQINFVGNVEGRDIPYGKCDILVCDGFVGNAVLKSMEGIASLIIELLKEEMMKNHLTKLGALLLKDGFKNILKRMDYKEYGGVPLLGINGAVIKAHGSSDSYAFLNAVRQARIFVKNDVLNNLKVQVSNIGVK